MLIYFYTCAGDVSSKAMGTKFSKTGGREEEEGEPPPNLRHEDAS
jgi:hypothetical protein